MKVLTPIVGGNRAKCRRVVLLFGFGLIGSAVVSDLKKNGWQITEDIATDWWDVTNLRRQASDCRALLKRKLVTGDVPVHIDLVWSAGKAGFGESAAVFDREWDSFRTVLDMAGSLKEIIPNSRAHFHLMSSGGGLFEGQTFVDPSSKPKPMRPYGAAKLRQEYAVANAAGLENFLIYRPSSVYGYSRNGRAGLISTLITNSFASRVTNIFGSPHTLRDFILTDDIARFVGGRIRDHHAGSGTFLLASAKPTSMYEVMSILSDELLRPLYLQYDNKPSNARDNSFRPTALPDEFQPTVLAVGIRQLALRIFLAMTQR